MNQVGNHLSCETEFQSPSAEPTNWATLPVAITGTGDGQALALPPNLSASNSRVHLGGQAPMFLPELIADAGLVRLGGQSPIL